MRALRRIGRALACVRAPPGRREVPATEEVSVRTRFPIGHYYSPAPDPLELAEEPRRSQIWPPTPRETVGVDWREDEQVRLCRDVFAKQPRLELADDSTGDPREYFASNDQFPVLDAEVLEGMLRHLQPTCMIEIGSGFSSLISARVNREHLGGAMALTCVEPYPRDFLVAGVDGITELRQEKVQDTPLEVFDRLGPDDVLFIDTSHTVKTGGDVPWLFNEILPRLRSGVVVHVHDVFLPGDYPQEWVLDGWGWNEIYLVQAFMAFNATYEIRFGCQFMIQRHNDLLLKAFPGYRAQQHRGGGSLWIRRR